VAEITFSGFDGKFGLKTTPYASSKSGDSEVKTDVGVNKTQGNNTGIALEQPQLKKLLVMY